MFDSPLPDWDDTRSVTRALCECAEARFDSGSSPRSIFTSSTGWIAGRFFLKS